MRSRNVVCIFAMLLGLVSCDSLGPGSSGDLDRLWAVGGELNSQPVIAGGMVIAGFVDGRVTAFDRISGIEVWTRNLGTSIGVNELRVFEEFVLVPALQLYAWDVASGAVRWRYDGAGLAAGVVSPTLSGDTLFVGGYTGNDAAALDLRTGVPYWTTDLGKAPFTPTVTDSLVLFAVRSLTEPGELVALDRFSGAIRWRRTLPDSVGFKGETSSAGVQVGDRVVLGTELSIVMAVRLSDGELLWEIASAHPSSGGSRGAPLRVGNRVLLQRLDGGFESRDPSDGTLDWFGDFQAASWIGWQSCAPNICRANGRVWVYSTDGRELWAYGGGNEAVFLTNVTVAEDGLMYAGVAYNNSDGRLIAFRPPIQVGATP